MAEFIIGRGVSDLTTPLTGLATGDVISFVEGSLAITAGLNLSGIGQLLNVYVTRDSMRNIAGNGDAIQLGVSGTLEYRATSGAMTVRPSCTNDGGTTANTIAKIVAAGGPATTLSVVGGGTLTNLRQTTGRVSVSGDVILTNASMTSSNVDVGYNSTGLSALYVMGGNHTIRRGIANSGVVKLSGGKVLFSRIDSAANSGITIGTSVTFDITGPCEVTWKGGNNTSATVIPRINLLHPQSRFYWQDMPGDTTVTDITGHPEALVGSGITNPSSGATYTAGTNATLTVTNALDILGVTTAKYDAGGMLGPR